MYGTLYLNLYTFTFHVLALCLLVYKTLIYVVKGKIYNTWYLYIKTWLSMH